MWTLPRTSARAVRDRASRAPLSRLWRLVVLFLLVCPLPLLAQANPQQSNLLPGTPLTVGGKFRFYVKATYGPGALAGTAVWSGVNQWRDAPDEWGQGMAGYGRRYASRAGQRTVSNSIRFGIGAALREDPRYFPSERKGILPRMSHALASTFVTRTDSGGRRFAVSSFAGTLGSAFISNTWHPAREDDTNHAFKRAGISLAVDTGMNVFQEFWPDVKRGLRHH